MKVESFLIEQASIKRFHQSIKMKEHRGLKKEEITLTGKVRSLAKINSQMIVSIFIIFKRSHNHLK
jgi:hypothetical protein